MAKSDRHKKLRRKEKAKTQLTGVKKLGPAQNIIEPTFRAKKILIRDQLQNPSEGEVVQISRNRSLQDVLHSLAHHNTNIKKDALQGLHEIISSQPEALYANLDKILEKIGSLTSDIEGSIRKENLELTEKILALLTEDQIKPFWNLLLTYIKCTLTNLNPAVRRSCLPFISLFLSYFPNLVTSSLQTLLPSVLGLISSVGKTSDPSTSSGKKVQTQLKLEISKQDHSKERVKVLQFLASCLDLHNSKRRELSRFESNANKKPSLTFSDSSPITHVGLYYPFGYEECQGESYYYGSQGSSKVGTSLGIGHSLGSGSSLNYLHHMGTATTNVTGSSIDDINDTKFWPHFVESCLPLLHQTWLEIRPALKDGNIDNRAGKEQTRGLRALPTVAIEILECIVSVMTRLILSGNISKNESWSSTLGRDSKSSILRQLRKNHGSDLKKYFFQWIPFSAIQDSERKALTLMNLQLFYIAAQLRLIDAQIMEKFNHYVHVLMKKSTLDSMQMSILLNILPLIRISTVDMLTSKVLIHAVSSGHFESVHAFLLRILDVGQGTSKDGGGVMLHSINLESIVEIILKDIPSFTSPLFNILTQIALRRLLDLQPILRQQTHQIQRYLTNGKTNLDTWDEVVRLLHFSDCLDILLNSNYFNLNPPPDIQETVIGLTMFYTPTTSALEVNSITEAPMEIEVES